MKGVKNYLNQMKLWRKKTEKVKSKKCIWKNICLYLKKKEKTTKKQLIVSEAVKGGDLWKKMFLKVSLNSQENICVRECLRRHQPGTLLKKRL